MTDYKFKVYDQIRVPKDSPLLSYRGCIGVITQCYKDGNNRNRYMIYFPYGSRSPKNESVNIGLYESTMIDQGWEKVTSENMLKEQEEKVIQSETRPAHYGGNDNPFEAIKIIEHYELGFCLGNTVKYILRAGKKAGESEVKDLKKAMWYINRRIEELTKEKAE